MVKWLLRGLTLVAGAFLVFYLLANQYLTTPISLSDSQRQLVLERGHTVTTVANRLAAEGLLFSPRFLTIYARLTGQTRVKAGEYLLPELISRQQILQTLNAGDVISYQWTLVEGWNVHQVLASLRQQEKLLITLVDDQSVAAWLADQGLFDGHMEGWLYPDTYFYHKGDTDHSLLQRAYQKMQQVLAEEWEGRAEGLPYATPYEALIMASIIEKETGAVDERQAIAGVFVRRLQKKMRLQTDPTVIYGLGREYTGNIQRKHLRQMTPYNTYRIDGLPPTPIAMPGRAAIYAALHPAEGEALYFVARGDGSHYFSATLAEHERAVQKYQVKQRRPDYQTAPSSSKVIE